LITDSATLTNLTGQYLEIRVTLIRTVSGGTGPTLHDLTIACGQNQTPPSVQLTSPTNNAVWCAGNLTLTALATPNSGASITNVIFRNGTNLPGSATAGGGNSFSLTWTNAPVGTNTLTAVATDNLGLSSTSAPVTFQVAAATSGSISPASLTACPGATATFSTTVTGGAPFSYVWKRTGVSCPA